MGTSFPSLDELLGSNEQATINHGVGAERVNVAQHCKKCNAPLTLEEMHYYDRGDGTATCNTCEEQWMAEMAAWKRGDRESMPGTGQAVEINDDNYPVIQ